MPREASDPRERILDAARDAFRRHGVAKTRLGHVAEEAACSRATLYRYFATKEALVLAYAHRELDLSGKRVLARIAGERRLGDRLALAMVASVETVRNTPAIAPFLAPDAETLAIVFQGAGSAMSPSLFATLLAVVGDHDGKERLRPDLPANELLEWTIRIVLSLAIAPGPPRTRAELRGVIERLVRPAFVESAE